MPPFRDNFSDASMLLGYARAGTDDQHLALQRRAVCDPASASDGPDEPALT
jgi:hypothetical protein